MRAIVLVAALLLGIALLWLGSGVGGDRYVPEGWTLADPPRTESQWQCANHSLDEWSVALTGTSDIPTITPFDWESHSVVRLALDDGLLEGFNHGEFGGAVDWIDAAGDTTRIFTGNPVALVPSAEGIVLAAGLAHLGFREGDLFLLTRDGSGGWDVTPIVDLEDAPVAVLPLSPDSLLIAASTGVQVVSLETRSRYILHQNEQWPHVYGTSVARDSRGTIYVGLRRGVARLTPIGTAYREEWLVPKSCARLKSLGGLLETCRCLPSLRR